jgi:predicted Zn-dependent protease
MPTTEAHVWPPGTGCALCCLSRRRVFTRLVAGGGALLLGGRAVAQQPQPGAQPAPADGVRGDVGRTSRFARLVPADALEGQAGQQYQQMMRAAQQQGVLAAAGDRQVQRLRAIAQRIVPFAPPWNVRAPQWKWEVNLLNQPTVNAFCMPGGKIAFYMGILRTLQLNDDEVAAIMGHEVAHALREHARERFGKTVATQAGAGLVSALLGLGSTGQQLVNMGSQLLTLKFSRDDETEADIVGMDLAARAGYDPAAGVTLWQKMMNASKNKPPEFISTHPAGDTRIKDIQGKLPKVKPLFERAPRPQQAWGPPQA